MPFQRFITAGLLTIASITVPLVAIASQPQQPPQLTAQAAPVPTVQQILDACNQNQAERLANPFTDVPSNHWAFKAVLTLHYCGANRQAASSHLFKQSTQPSVPGQ